MKLAVSIAALGLLAACASDDTVEGVKTGKDTNGFMLTSAAPAQVAKCIATLLGSPAQSEGVGFVITPTSELPVAYHVRPFEDKLHRYTTIVEITGSTALPKGVNPALCLGGKPITT